MYFKTNPFIVHNSSRDRLRVWKEVRQRIPTLTEAEALDFVAEYWAYTPLSTFSYNLEAPGDWPTEWEMVSTGDWCRHMIPVAMEATLRLAGWDSSRLKIVSMRDYDLSDELTVLKIDDSHALNYTQGRVVKWPNTEQIITGIITHVGKKYEFLPTMRSSK